MLPSIKRWMGRERPGGVDWSDVVDWAADRRLDFRRERDDRGFVVEGTAAGRPWRLEWGPPQRDYLAGRELRLRCEAGLPPELQMLLITAPLAEALEREAFSRFTEQAQTEVDLALPEEMRWLALFRRVPLAPWRGLRGRLDAVAALPGTVEAWLQEGDFCTHVERALAPTGDGGDTPANAARARPLDPLVLMTLRGRLYLRTELAEPHLPTLDAARRLFEAALQRLEAPVAVVRSRAAVRVGPTARPDPDADEALPFDDADGGESTAWQTRAPGDDGDDGNATGR